MSATAEFRLHASFDRLPPGRAYMAEWVVLDANGSGIYWPGGQTLPSKPSGTLQVFIGLDDLSGNGVYRVHAAAVVLRDLTAPHGTGAALDLDGRPLVIGPVDTYFEADD